MVRSGLFLIATVIAVKCSAAFATTGIKITPIKDSEIPDVLVTASIELTKQSGHELKRNKYL
jgi:hypothetical protein